MMWYKFHLFNYLIFSNLQNWLFKYKKFLINRKKVLKFFLTGIFTHTYSPKLLLLLGKSSPFFIHSKRFKKSHFFAFPHNFLKNCRGNFSVKKVPEKDVKCQFWMIKRDCSISSPVNDFSEVHPENIFFGEFLVKLTEYNYLCWFKVRFYCMCPFLDVSSRCPRV